MQLRDVPGLVPGPELRRLGPGVQQEAFLAARSDEMKSQSELFSKKYRVFL